MSKNIKSTGKKPYFRAGSWQHYIAEAIANFNPYCTIMFRSHLVYQSTKRKSRTDKLFSANGFCKHETCGVKNVQLTLKSELRFKLIFNGQISSSKTNTRKAKRNQKKKIIACIGISRICKKN